MSTCLSETDVDEFLASHLGPEANARVEAHLAKCDNRRTYLSFAEVIVVRHVRVIQERKDVLAIAAQTFGQSPGVGIRMFFPGHFTDPAVQPVDPALIPLGREVRTLPQADAVTQQPAQLLGERPPLGTVVLRFFRDRFIPRQKNLGQPLPGVDQSAGGQLRLQMVGEPVPSPTAWKEMAGARFSVLPVRRCVGPQPEVPG